MREAFVGFDSAWAGKNPGGVCFASFQNGQLDHLETPKPADFERAKSVVERCHREADFTLVAIDQPTMVPNSTGMRPVERVAGSLKAGVQPANHNSAMFNRTAPIWEFLDGLSPQEDPLAAQRAKEGLHLIEVFPGLALPALEPAAGQIKSYNPKNRKFRLEDWRLVANAVHCQAKDLNIEPMAQWASAQSRLAKPTKGHQDCLDAAICLIVALKWRRGDEDTVALGDWQGYMVTPLSKAGKGEIENVAEEKAVPIGRGSWKLFEAALSYFDGRHYDAFKWLGHPNPALRGETPLDHAKTPLGLGDVLDLIGRLEHGIPT